MEWGFEKVPFKEPVEVPSKKSKDRPIRKSDEKKEFDWKFLKKPFTPRDDDTRSEAKERGNNGSLELFSVPKDLETLQNENIRLRREFKVIDFSIFHF